MFEEPEVAPIHFYRSQTKTGKPVNFVNWLSKEIKSEGPRAQLSLLTQQRALLLDILHKNPTATSSDEQLIEALKRYLSLLLGFIVHPNDGSDSGLRKRISFSWSNIIDPEEKTTVFDAQFDVCSVLLTATIWMINKASSLAQTVTQSNADQVHKEMYHLLLKAAGVCQELESQSSKLQGEHIPYELKPELVKVMKDMILAMGQEVTIQRAIFKKNKSSLIAKLAVDVHTKYSTFYYGLNEFSKTPGAKVHKIRSYAKYKMNIYEAVALQYHGDHISVADKEHGAGQAVCGLEKAKSMLTNLDEVITSYADFSPKTDPKIPMKELEVFLQSITKSLNSKKLENDHLYFQSTDDLPELPQGIQLTEPEAFEMPPLDDTWNSLYDEFKSAFKDASEPKLDNKNDNENDNENEKEKDKNETHKDNKKHANPCLIL